jgi:uncharacterized protein (TIGR02145 family)
MLKKISLLVCVFNFLFCSSQNIEDVNGNSIKYRKVGSLYWSDNISTTKMWSTKRKLTLVQSAPMPSEALGGGYLIDQSSKPIYSNRYYLNYDGNYYYTWNTANNFTAFKEITNQTKKFNQIPNANVDVSNSSICPCGWRVPNVDDVSDLLVSTKVFNSKEKFTTYMGSLRARYYVKEFDVKIDEVETQHINILEDWEEDKKEKTETRETNEWDDEDDDDYFDYYTQLDSICDGLIFRMLNET